MIEPVKTIPYDVNHYRAELCRKEFFYFVQTFWEVIIPEDPIWNWHIPYLCNKLQGIAEGVRDRQAGQKDLIINIPPGTTKSTICTIMFPLWCWTIDPTLRILTASYAYSLSLDHCIRSRDILRSNKFRQLFPDVRIKKDEDNKSHYRNTEGGERMATSVGGSVTGFHAHLLIVDDPLNAQEALSEVKLQDTTRFIDQTLSTRKVDKDITTTVLIMQRLHVNDPTGHWLEQRGEDIDHICLPAAYSAQVKPAEVKAYYDKGGGLLDPVRLSQATMDNLKKQLGSYGYAGQILQQPTPLEGSIWQPEWFKPIARKDIPELKHVGTDFDLAYTKNERNSASAWITAGVNNYNMYVTGLGFMHKEFPEMIAKMKTIPPPHYVEAMACFSEGTLVNTKEGYKPIEKIKKGDFVLSVSEVDFAFEYQIVKNTYAFAPIKHKMIKFVLKSGHEIRCTENHLFYFEGAWVKAGRIAQRAMEKSREVLCIQHGEDFNNEIQKPLPKRKTQNTFSGNGQTRISENGFKWQNRKGAQVCSKSMDTKPGQQTRSKSHKRNKTRQQGREFGMGNQIREPKAFRKSGTTQRFSERPQIQQSKRLEKRNSSSNGKDCPGNEKEIQTQEIHSANDCGRVRGKLAHSYLCPEHGMEAREINLSEIQFAEAYESYEVVYDIEVSKNHNFCITEENIVVHNSGKSAVQTLKAQGIPAIEVRIQGGDKIARTTLMSPYAEAGNIFVASDILDELLYDSTQGLLNFPNGSHDDLNDAFTQAINRLLNKKKVVVF